MKGSDGVQSDRNLCPVCEDSSLFAFETPHTHVRRCCNRKCRHLFAVVGAPHQGVMSPLTDGTKDYGVFEERDRHLVRYWRRIGFLRDGFRILDFGSGVGHIVRAIKEQMKVEVTCIEAEDAYCPGLHSMGCRVLTDLRELQSTDQYDAVLMIEVIEHLDCPVAILRKIREHLNSRGSLFLSTPAGDLRHPVPEPWNLGAYDTPHHIQFFTPTSLRLALRRAGFRRTYYRFVNEMLPNDDMRQSDYESFWAKKNALKQQIQYWRKGSHHLTFIAR